jgi:carbamoyl-phosphate synthase large subunit
MLGVRRETVNRSLDLDFVGVKAPMFSFARLAGADPVTGVEMLSTGEVGCLGRDLGEALSHALLAADRRLPRRGVLLSLGPVPDKYSFADEARTLAHELHLPIFATPGTADMLTQVGIACVAVAKGPADGVSALDLIEQGRVDLVINVSREYDAQGRPDGYLIRRQAADSGVPLVTDLQLARALVGAMAAGKGEDKLSVVAWNDYVATPPSPPGRGARPKTDLS